MTSTLALLLLSALLGGQASSGVTARQGGATHVLIITGLSGEPRFARAFGEIGRTVFDAARASWHVSDSSLVYLAEDPAADPQRIAGKATGEGVRQAFSTLATRVRAGDVVLIFLVGHGSGEMQASAVNLPGPDPVASDYASWLAPLGRADVVFVNASSASGDFGAVLAGPGRVIVTATKSAIERNETLFGAFFAAGLTGTEADANKDGRVTVAEAFNFARERVARAYETTGRLQTEHAVLIDSSGLAARVAFGGDAASGDARVLALLGERRMLEGEVDSLRRAKTTIDPATYQSALEALLLRIAEHTQAIRALTAKPKP